MPLSPHPSWLAFPKAKSLKLMGWDPPWGAGWGALVCVPTGFSLSTLKSAGSLSDLHSPCPLHPHPLLPQEAGASSEPGQKRDSRDQVSVVPTWTHGKATHKASCVPGWAERLRHLARVQAQSLGGEMLSGEVFVDPVQPGPLPRLGGAGVGDNSGAGLQERSSDWLLRLGCPLLLSSTRLHWGWCPHSQATEPSRNT